MVFALYPHLKHLKNKMSKKSCTQKTKVQTKKKTKSAKNKGKFFAKV